VRELALGHVPQVFDQRSQFLLAQHGFDEAGSNSMRGSREMARGCGKQAEPVWWWAWFLRPEHIALLGNGCLLIWISLFRYFVISLFRYFVISVLSVKQALFFYQEQACRYARSERPDKGLGACTNEQPVAAYPRVELGRE
jgi:hypothetical protein